MSRVLVIANGFPPASSSGVQRTLGFVRYLSQYNWQPVVLTVNNPTGAAWDSELLSRVPSNVPVIRTHSFNPRLAGKRLYLLVKDRGRLKTQEELIFTPVSPNWPIRSLRDWMHSWLFVPDEAIGWLPFAAWAGLRAIKTHRVKVLYSTSPPPTNHLIALILKRLTGLPWVADFRDLWTQSPYVGRRQAYRLLWRRRLEEWLERQVFRRADRIVTVSEPIRATLLQSSPNPDPARFYVITNGYDPATAKGIQRQPFSRFTITYTGMFYESERSPVSFFQALSTLLRAGSIEATDMLIRIIGRSYQEVSEIVKNDGLGDMVTVMGQVPHIQALQEQRNASVLLLVVGTSLGERDALTGKVFEYLAARRPILGLVPKDSAVADLLRRSQAGLIVNPTDSDAIKAAILRLYQEFKNTGDVRWHGRDDFTWDYTRTRLTAKLAGLFDTMDNSK